jgi:hypothetical protein
VDARTAVDVRRPFPGQDPDAHAPMVSDTSQVGASQVRDRGGRRQEKLWPQPQVRLALGFVIANPDCSRPSL